MYVHVQELPLPQRRNQSVRLRPVDLTLCRRQPVDQPVLVLLSLQMTNEPRSRVRKRFVIEIDRVLRREDQADAERARLLQQPQNHAMGRRTPGRRFGCKERTLLRWRI